MTMGLTITAAFSRSRSLCIASSQGGSPMLDRIRGR
jgi:hypothetical protein